jgi:hypothetical protein
MTVPSGPVVFNSDTGSDSAASGLGPDTVVAGTVDVTSASSTLTNAVASSGSLSDVGVGDLIYITTSSGRKFSIVQGTNTGLGEFYTDGNWDVTETANWYVGGKRATFDGSEQLFQTTYNPATHLEITMETDQTVTIDLCGVGAINCYRYIKSDSPSIRRKISYSGGTYLFKGGRFWLYDLELEATDPNTNQSIAYAATTGTIQNCSIKAYNCIFGNATNPWYTFGSQSARPVDLQAFGCKFQNFDWYVCYSFSIICHECVFTNNSSYIYGTSGTTTSPGGGTFVGCIFNNNVEGFYARWGWAGVMLNCIAYNSGTTQPFFHLTKADRGYTYGPFERNIFVNCSLAVNSSADFYARGNVYYNCGWYGFNNEIDPITLTADPFVNAANGDYRINKTIGGGAVLRSAKVLRGG